MIEKSEATKQKIRDRLTTTFMFSALDEKESNIVIDAMEEYKVNAGETVIKEGDRGDELFVVE